MKLIPEKPIDIIYLEELEEIAEWYEWTIDEAIKQGIRLDHREIKKTKKYNNGVQ